MLSKEINELSEKLLSACRTAKLRLTTAESCTGGLVAAAITDVPGASHVFERGYVTYANSAKTDLLGVPAELLDRVGAVSEDVARAMAEGALKDANADVAVSITGVAGPSGGTESKPVGLVHMAAARRGRTTLHERHVFDGDRAKIRRQSVAAALALGLQQVETP